MTEIILIRHGETAWNAEQRLQGHLDIPLNAAGLSQAAALAEVLAQEPVDAIFSSDLQRAMQTAQAVAATRKMAVLPDAGLRERCYGGFEGLLYADLSARFPQEHAAWLAREVDAGFPPGESAGESLREFNARVLASLQRIVSSGEYRKIVVVCHGGVLDCFYRQAAAMPLEMARDFDVMNASINRFRWSDGQLQMMTWGEVAHLPSGALDEIAR